MSSSTPKFIAERGFNISNTPFALLAKEIDAGRLALHVCDITLAEIHRQLKEQ